MDHPAGAVTIDAVSFGVTIDHNGTLSSSDYSLVDTGVGTAPPRPTPPAISFTGPGTGIVGGQATLSATGGASGIPIAFSLEAASGGCNLSGNEQRHGQLLRRRQLRDQRERGRPDDRLRCPRGQAPHATVGDRRRRRDLGTRSDVHDNDSDRVFGNGNQRYDGQTIEGRNVQSARRSGGRRQLQRSARRHPELCRLEVDADDHVQRAAGQNPRASAGAGDRERVVETGGDVHIGHTDRVPSGRAGGATITLLLAGTCTVRAAQAGNTVYAAAPTVSRSFRITAARPISFRTLTQILAESPWLRFQAVPPAPVVPIIDRARCAGQEHVSGSARAGASRRISHVIDGGDVEDIFWWHSVDLGDRVAPGHKSPELLEHEWAGLHLPELSGKSVLDIGAWDGYFSFRAEREGAARVVALDHYVWSLDLPRQQAYWRDSRDRGVAPEPYHEQPELWHPDTLPGKAGFDLAHASRNSRVESMVADFMTADLDAVGAFDIVLFLGVLYHLEEPFTAMRRLRRLTNALAVIESEAIAIEGQSRPILEFLPGAEVNADVGNWWVPTEAGLHGLCLGAGFSEVETVVGPPAGHERYRLVVHARV